MERLTDQVVTYASDLSFADLSADVIGRAKTLITDAVGCAIGASSQPPALIAQAMAAEVTSSQPATVMATGQKTSPDLAAFANGTMIRYLDLNDTYLNGGDTTDMLAPVLPCAEVTKGGGQDVILGFV